MPDTAPNETRHTRLTRQEIEERAHLQRSQAAFGLIRALRRSVRELF